MDQPAHEHARPTTAPDLAEVTAALADPRSYPFPVGHVEVRHTHISVVFLAGESVYKVKKPVNLGFLDFSTLDLRRHFCEEEVRLNRRLAPGVYLGAVPIVAGNRGLTVEGAGDVVEWAVKMRRLPDEATLLHLVQKGGLDLPVIRKLACRVAEFHAAARGGAAVAAFGRFDVVAANARENFAQSKDHVGLTVSQAVYDRLGRLTDEALDRLRPLIDDRAGRGVPRDTHGDLHLDHVYHFPDRPPPDDLVAIDCIEFNERFRFADPVADAAFLAMDLTFHGRPDLAAAFADAYFAASGDAEGRGLLAFYVAYRAAVRAKVEGIKAVEPEVPEPERAAARELARSHWLLALGELESPDRRPTVVLVAGLPGTGKSTLARRLADRADFAVVRSDVVRKELADMPLAARAPVDLYGAGWTERTYVECRRRAEALLWEGRRVIVDATFAGERHRDDLLALAARLAVPAVMFVCQADPETVRRRLAARTGDASDADCDVYLEVARRWNPLGPTTQPIAVAVPTAEPADAGLATAVAVLRARGLLV